jgi:hypothetical protein
MAIARDSQSASGFGQGYSGSYPGIISWSHTCGAGNNRILLVWFYNNIGSGNDAIANVSYNGVPMTRIFYVPYAPTSTAWYLYALIAPPVGTYTIYAETGFGITAGIGGSYTGVRQDNVPLGYNYSFSYTTDNGAAVTTVVDHSWIVGRAEVQNGLGGTPATWNSVLTDLIANPWVSNQTLGDSGPLSPGTYTPNYTHPSAYYTFADSVVLEPAPFGDPIVLVQSATTSDASALSSKTTGSFTLTAGNLVVILYGCYDQSPASPLMTGAVTGSASTPIDLPSVFQDWGVHNVAPGQTVGAAYCIANGGSQTFTVTMSGIGGANPNNWNITVLEYSGIDQENPLNVAIGTGGGGGACSNTYQTDTRHQLLIGFFSSSTGLNTTDWSSTQLGGVEMSRLVANDYQGIIGNRIVLTTQTASSGANANGGIGLYAMTLSFRGQTTICRDASVISNSGSWTHTNAASAVLMAFWYEYGPTSTGTATYNGVASDYLYTWQRPSDGNARLMLAYWKTPAAGAHTVALSLTNSLNASGSVSYTGVSRTVGPDANGNDGAWNSGNAQVTLTASIDEVWQVGFAETYNQPFTVAAGSGMIPVAGGTNFIIGDWDNLSGGDSHTMQATDTANLGMIAVGLIPASAPVEMHALIPILSPGVVLH